VISRSGDEAMKRQVNLSNEF